MTLHASISLDYRDALESLRRFRREYAEMMDLPTVARVDGKAAVSAARETAKDIARERTAVAREEVRQQGQLEKEKVRQAATNAREASRQVLQIERDTARQRERSERDLSRQKLQMARETTRQQTRLEIEASRQSERASREAARAKMQAAREAAREELRIKRETAREAARIERAQLQAQRQAQRAQQNARRDRSSARGELTERASNSSTLAGAGILATLGLAVRESITFEDSFSDVKKTVDATDAQLVVIERRLRNMAAGKNPIPIDVNELNRIAASGGQLGVATSNIVEFTRTMAEMGVTTNLSSDEAATGMARLANITQMPQQNFERLGSTIVDLGNKFAANEREILEMSLRLAGAGHQIGLTEAQIVSFATTLSSVGVEAEAGGSSFSRVFVEIDKAARTGGDSLKAFSAVAGMSSQEFKAAYEKDAAGAIKSFVEGLGNIQKAGGNTFGVLEKLGLSEIRVRDALLRTAGAGDLLSKSLDVGAEAWQKNNALQNEASKKFATTASQLKITQNELRELGIEGSKTLMPAFRSIVSVVRDLLGDFNKLSPETRDNIVRFTAYAGIVLFVGGRVKTLIEILGLLRRALILNTAATLATGDASVVAAGKVGILSRTLTGLRALIATPVGKGGLIAALAALAGYGVVKTYEGVRDSNLSDEENQKKNGAWGSWWNWGGRQLGTNKALSWSPLGWMGGNNPFGQAHIGMGETAGNLSADLFARLRKKDLAEQRIALNIAQMGGAGGRGGVQNVASGVSSKAQDAKKAAQDAIKTLDQLDSASDKSTSKQKAAQQKAYNEWKRLRLDQLDDAKQMWDGIAKAAEDATQRQIEAIQGVRDGLRGLFGGIQNSFAERGAVGGADAILAKWERIFNLGGKLQNAAASGQSNVDYARSRAGHFDSASDVLRGGDGSSPRYSGGKATRPGRAPAWLVAMENDAGKSFGRNCAEEIKARLRGFGVKSVGSLRAGSTNSAWRVGFDENGRLPAGTIVRYPPGMAGRGRVGHRFGHYQAVGSDLETWTESNVVGKDRISAGKRAIDWNRLRRDVAAGRAMAYAPPGALNRTVAVAARQNAERQDVTRQSNSSLFKGNSRMDSALRDAYSQASSGQYDLSGSLRELGKLPEAWGPAVARNENTTHRFAAQLFLLSKAGQELLKTMSPARLKEFRKDFNDLDTSENKARNSREYLETVKARRTAIAQEIKSLSNDIGSRSNNPVAQLNDRLRAGEFGGVSKSQVNDLYGQTRVKMREEAARPIREETKAIQDRIKAMQQERAMIARGITDQQQRNETLEIERERIKDIDSLTKAGWPKRAAEYAANVRASASQVEKAFSRDMTRAQEEAEAKASRLSEAYDALATALGRTDTTAEALAQTLSDLPPDAAATGAVSSLVNQARDRINALRSDEASGSLIGDAQGKAGEYSSRLRDLKNSSAFGGAGLSEVQLLEQQKAAALNRMYAQQAMSGPGADIEKQKRDVEDLVGYWDSILRDARAYAAINKSNAFNEFTKAHNRRMDVILAPNDAQRQMIELKHQLEDQSIKDPIQIKAILDMHREENRLQEKSDFWRGVAGEISSSFNGMFDSITQGSGSMFSRLKDGAVSTASSIAQSFLQMSQQIIQQFIQNWILQQVLGMAMPGGGSSAGGFGGPSNPLALGPGHAAGLNYVPRDNYVARLHKDEAVLTASQARVWRGMMQGAAQIPAANGAGGTHNSSNIGSVTINVHGARDAKETAREVKKQLGPRAGQGFSRAENARRSYEGASVGSRYAS